MRTGLPKMDSEGAEMNCALLLEDVDVDVVRMEGGLDSDVVGSGLPERVGSDSGSGSDSGIAMGMAL